MTDTDRINNADPARISTALYAVIDGLQSYRPEERLLAASAHFKLLFEAHPDVTVQDLMTAAANLMASPDGQYRRPEFQAARLYVENER